MAKNRSDSVHVAASLAGEAGREIMPPEMAKMKDRHVPFFRMVVAQRHAWNDLDLLLACHLAEALSDLREYKDELDRIGPTVLGGKSGNTVIKNPMFDIVENTTRRVTLLTQKLQVHAQATMGDPRNSRTKNKAKQDYASAFNALDEEDLIAKPN